MAKGYLRPGVTSQYSLDPLPARTGEAIAASQIRLHAEADQLHLSWHSPSAPHTTQNDVREAREKRASETHEGDSDGSDDRFDEVTETVSLVWVPCNYGNHQPFFICPGSRDSGFSVSADPVPASIPADVSGSANTNSAEASTGPAAVGVASAAAAANRCGRQVRKLYISQGCSSGPQFLCRQCSQLVYDTPYELPWQRAIRRRDKARRRLGLGPEWSAAEAPKKPGPITAARYEYLLNELLKAELKVTETQTEYFLQLAERIAKLSAARNRRKSKRASKREAQRESKRESKSKREAQRESKRESKSKREAQRELKRESKRKSKREPKST
jgi:hypothetical protein